MKKSYLFSAMLAALMLAGCAESTENLQTPREDGQAAVRGKTPVGFSAYADRGTSKTRAGKSGTMIKDSLRSEYGGGFGVFAYYTDLKKYDQTYIPNFMYNQGVFDTSGSTEEAVTANWEYSPVMYWPNEYGSDAQSDDEDKVSFFAYAPYVKHSSAAAGSVDDADWGITGFSRNTSAGDPIVKYIASFEASKSVDLCWGVCAQTGWSKLQNDEQQRINDGVSGLPWLNVEHPKGIQQKMTFTFKHALSQLNVQIDADPDVLTHDATTEIAAETKVYVRSISFTGIAMQGALNLNNSDANKAQWLDYSGLTDLPYGQSVTVKDGRRDGREGASGAEANNELPKGLNPVIVQSTTWEDNSATAGVTGDPVNLFQPFTKPANPSAVTPEEKQAMLGDPVFVIPTGEAMTVTIVYDIETKNDDLSTYLSDGVTHGATIENRISKTVKFGDVQGLENGKKYVLKLHLGMNSVKFDAAITNWQNTAGGEAFLPTVTGEGVFNALNPLGILAPGTGTDFTATDGNATTATLTGIDARLRMQSVASGTGDGKMQTWTVTSQDGTVAQIAPGTPVAVPTASPTRSAVRRLKSGTRAPGDTVWSNRVENAKAIVIKTLKKGIATITATDGEGNKSSCIITVDASDVTLDVNKLSLYKFQSGDAPESIVNVVNATIEQTKAYTDTWPATAWKVISITDANGVKADTTDVDLATKAAQILTIAQTNGADANTNKFTVTPVGKGSATVELTTEKGAKKTFTVSVAEPSLTISATVLQLRGGSDPTKVVLTAKTVPEDLEVTFTDAPDGTPTYTFEADNANKRATVTGSKTAENDGTGVVTVTVNGHNDLTATCSISVSCADAGQPLYNYDGEGNITGDATDKGMKVGRIICSDVAKSYASVSEAEMWGHKPIAVIAYVGTDENPADITDYDDATDGVQNYKHLAMALKDVNNSATYTWKAENTDCDCLSTANVEVGTNYGNSTSPVLMSVYNGISLTDKLTATHGDGHTHNCALAAKNFTDEVIPGTTFAAKNSSWFLPSIGQWNLIIKTLCSSASGTIQKSDGSAPAFANWGTDIPRWTDQNLGYKANGEDGQSGINAVLKVYGVGALQSADYWSSTECNGTYAWDVAFGVGTVFYNSKTNGSRVRPVLAF